MLKQITAILFFAAFIGQTFNKPFIIVDYYANNEAYLKACINKARPKMQCNGKCQMMKKLQEEEKKEQQLPGARPDTKTEIFSGDNFTYTIETPSVIIKKIFQDYIRQILPASNNSIFHPPQV